MKAIEYSFRLASTKKSAIEYSSNSKTQKGRANRPALRYTHLLRRSGRSPSVALSSEQARELYHEFLWTIRNVLENL